MVNAILERRFEEPLNQADFFTKAKKSEGCFALHRVEWQRSLLSADGYRLVCWFQAADLESIRTAMRSENIDMSRFWGGTVHDAPDASEEEIAQANVMVERRFPEAVTLAEIQAIEDAGASCLEMRNVRFLRTFFSANHQRMLCLYHAPDAESVRQAQREAKVPFEKAWRFRAISYKDFMQL